MENLLKNNTEEKYKKAIEKSRDFEFFSLTAQDHKDMQSTPPDELIKNPDKAQYEVMTDKEISEYLDNAINCINNPRFIENGYAKIQKDFLEKSIPFLKHVNSLPEKFKDFDISSLDSRT